MAYRSWLKDVKSIHDLGEHCYADQQHPTDWDRYMARIDRYDEKWRARLKMDLPVAPEHRRFYGSRMHDSWVSKIERTDRELRVEVHSFDADNFAHCMARILEVPDTKAVLPVDLILRDPIYVNAVRHAPDGKLRWTDWQSVKAGDVPCEGPQYLHDWFFQQDNRIQWIAEIWHWVRQEGMLSTALHLLVDGSEAVARGRRGRALAKAFGDAVLPLWEDALGGVGHGEETYLWGYDTLYEYVERRMAAHGLSKSDFQSPAN